MPPSFDRCTSPRRRFNQNMPPSVVLLQQCHCRNRHRGKLQNLSPPSVLFFESSRFFLQYTGDTDAKNDGSEFWNSNYVIFENFLKLSKRRRAVPVLPIWTIMVAAKLDYSRSLWPSFINIGQLWKVEVSVTDTDTQTNSVENKGLSGLQSGQKAYMLNKLQCA